MNRSLLQPLRDVAALFAELDIPYALVGGIAAMTYGRSRFTEDIDLVAAANHQQVLAAHPEVMRAHRFDPSCTWKLYHESGVTIDIWKDQYSDAIASRARPVPLGAAAQGTPPDTGREPPVRIVDVHDLIAMKLRAARLQDDYDISEILKRTPVDDARLGSLVTPGQFTHFQEIRRRTPAA